MIEDKAELKTAIKEVLKELGIESESEKDIDDEGGRYQIAMLGHSADTTATVNKINEIINEFNKSLIDNRI